MRRHLLESAVALSLIATLAAAPIHAAPRALFDNTHAQTAGNADWIIDVNQPLPSPSQSTVTAGTPETFWTGANSSWGIALVKRGYQVATLTSTYGITYQDASNPYDLSNYDVFIVNEPNTLFTSAEASAILSYVQAGGGLIAISDHSGSDRNNDGYDSPMIWNALDPTHLLGVHFGVSGDANNNITQTSTNVAASSADSITHGPVGAVGGLAFHNGDTVTLYPSVNPSVRGEVWMNGTAQTSLTGVMCASSVYGNGRVVFETDSSPADDGTGQSGNSLFNGWGEAGANDSTLFLNATLWATRRNTTSDTQPPAITLSSPVGGENWGVGSTHAITWSASDNVGVTSVDLAYSTDGGATFPDVIATGLSNTGTYSWIVPSVITSTARVRATAHDAAGNVGADSSHANFSISGWAITASPGANGTIQPAGTTVVADGATPSFSISANSGYHVADVQVDAVSQGAITSYTFAPVHANHAIGATFAINSSDTQPPVATVTSPVGGESWGVGTSHSITWTATDNVGVTSIDLAYSTDGGATFPNAIAGGLANSGTYAWTVPAVLTNSARVRVTARDAAGNSGADSSHADFAITGWTVSSSAGSGGTISPSGATIVGDGATPTFTITPSAGYHVQDVLVNGTSVGAVTSYTFQPVHANATIAASFAPSSFTLSVTIAGSGSVTKNPDQPTYVGGTSVQLTATPAAGWNFAGWSGDATGSANPLTVTVTSNMNVTATFSQHVYTWNVAGAGAWTTSTNWTPTRSSPAADDVLIFSDGAPVTANGIPAQSVGKLRVTNNTNVTLVPASAVTLTMLGSGGLGLDLDSGSQITLNGSTALTLVATSAAIRGTIAMSGGAHRLESGNASGILFQGGSQLTLGTGFTGNVFGTGAAPGALNSVVFQSGSLYVQGAGANPFGATQPSSAVVFEAGSRFRLDANLTPSVSGRTYADFELNNAGTITPSGSAAWTMDSLIVSQGTLNLASLTAGGTIRGSIDVRTGAALELAPSGAYGLTLGGTSPSRVNVSGTFAPGSNVNVTLNDAAGVTLTSNVTLSGGLNFIAGVIATGGNTLTIASTGTITGAGQGSGWVAGNLKRNIASGTSSRTFDIGDEATYAPAMLTVNGAASAFDLTASTHVPDHPNLATSGLDPNKSVNRWWTLTPAASPSFTSFDATFSFAAGDVDAAAQTNNFLVRRYSGGWTSVNTGARTANSTQGTGVTGFGDFALGELLVYTLTVSTNGSGSVQKSPDQSSYTPGTAVQLTATPAAGFTFGGWSGDTMSTANPITVAIYANKNLTATFIGTTYTITASADQNGTIAPAGTVVVNSGGSQSFAISPNSGYQVSDVLVDGVSVGPVTSYSFTNVVANHTIAATFGPVGAGVDAGPLTFALRPPQPNPSMGGVVLCFSLPSDLHTRLEILDASGRRITIHEGDFGAGRYQWRWEGTDMSGSRVSSGVYFARLSTSLGVRRGRITLLH
jgi:uncharacterized repeat protein (TIGR02543 family)